MTIKEKFTERYNDVKQTIIDAMDEVLKRAIGNEVLNLDNMADNYTDVFPLIAAVLQRETAHCLEGSSYESTRRAQKRQATKYRGDYRIWMSYAGDYTYNN